MSFDLDIETVDADGNLIIHEVVCGQTYNLSPMWCKALLLNSTKDLDGRLCRDLWFMLQGAVLDIIRNEKEFVALNPENGWGDFEGFFEIFVKFTRMCHKYPSGTVRWSG